MDTRQKKAAGKGRQNLNEARNMDVDAWRARQVAKRTWQHFEEEAWRFAAERPERTDEELTQLVRERAEALGRMPHALELRGGLYIRSRLGDWEALARSLGLTPVRTRDAHTQTYRREYRRQEELFCRERREKKAEKRRKAAARAAVPLLLLCLLLIPGCGRTAGSAGNGGMRLDLDYTEVFGAGETETGGEEETPVWSGEGFSYGEARRETPAPGVQADSVAELYGSAPSQTPPPEAGSGPEGGESQETPSPSPAHVTPPPEAAASTPPERTGEPTPRPTEAPETPAYTPAPTPEPTMEPQRAADAVTLSVRCDTAVKNGLHLDPAFAGIVPASGTVLEGVSLELREGDTVLSVLLRARDTYKLQVEYRGGEGSGAYVEGINGLYEFDGGRWSGWMYSVNGWYPNYGCGQYVVKAGDEICWNYTCDLGLDLNAGMAEAEGWKDANDG